MSSPSPHDALSPRESLYASVRMRLVSKGTKRLVAWGGKAQGRRRPSLTPQLCPQVPIRSALASINIVAACTSSLMITSALGSAVTISLPYVGKDLNVQKDELQWILSAYSISSVSIFIIQHGFAEPGLTLRTGLLPSPLWATCRSLRAQIRLAYWILDHRNMWPRGNFRAMCVRHTFSYLCSNLFFFATRSRNSARHYARDTRDRGCCHDPCLCRSPLGNRFTGSERATIRQLGILSKAFPSGPSRSIAFATFSAGSPIGSAFSTVFSSFLTQLTR